MTAPDPQRPALARSARLVRRVLAPAGLELEGRMHWLDDELNGLRRENAELRERVDKLTEEVDRLRKGLHEERRLQLRVAELADLVTELVLPLHDREIDPAGLRSLRPDTL